MTKEPAEMRVSYLADFNRLTTHGSRAMLGSTNIGAWYHEVSWFCSTSLKILRHSFVTILSSIKLLPLLSRVARLSILASISAVTVAERVFSSVQCTQKLISWARWKNEHEEARFISIASTIQLLLLLAKTRMASLVHCVNMHWRTLVSPELFMLMIVEKWTQWKTVIWSVLLDNQAISPTISLKGLEISITASFW